MERVSTAADLAPILQQRQLMAIVCELDGAAQDGAAQDGAAQDGCHIIKAGGGA